VKPRKVVVVTGTRADYGIFTPVLRALVRSRKFRVQLVVTGMHLVGDYGKTIRQIRGTRLPIVGNVDILFASNTKEGMARSVGLATLEFAPIFSRCKPDVILLLGDRGEMLAAATAALYLNIPVAHLHGGEFSGTVDDIVRRAITKMSYIHFASTRDHARTIIKMGEPANRVFPVGAPAIDTIRTLRPIPSHVLFKRYGLRGARPVGVFVMHPDTSDPTPPMSQVGTAIDGVRSFEGTLVILGANADAGGREFNLSLRQLAAGKAETLYQESFSHTEYLSWLAAADVLIGNSSSGIIEAASFGLPVVNIGGRQNGRQRSGNVIDVPYDAARVRRAIARACTDAVWRRHVRRLRNVYGDGHASERIVRALAALPLPPRGEAS